MLVSRNGDTRLMQKDNPFDVNIAKPRTMTLAHKRSLRSKSKPITEEVKRKTQ